MKLNRNDRIYYTGDMANLEGEGTISRVGNNGYGDQCDIVMDDGRLMRGVYFLAFEGGPGQRFYLLKEWEAKRQARIDAFVSKYSEIK